MVGDKKMAKAAGIVSLGTLLSRILGFVRDMIIAKMFGAGMLADAFFVAFRIPNMLRGLLGEGALSASFIPIFTEYLTKKNRVESWRMAGAALTTLALILTLVSLLGVLLAPILVRLIAPGFTAVPEKLRITILLTRLMFPYIFFVGLSALLMGILNSLGHFASPAFSPVMFNLSLIGAALFLAPHLREPILALAVGVLLGGLGQLMVQVPAAIKRGLPFRPYFDFANPALRRIGQLMAPGTVGLAITQVNVFISTLLASFLAEGSVSYIYYSFRLVHLPLGAFGVAIATVALPAMSSAVAQRSLERLKETFSFALRLAFFVTVPAMVGLLVFRVPIVHILFERGRFTRAMTLGTSEALLFFSLGLCFYVATRILVPVYHSFQDTRTPVKVGAVAVTGDILLSLLLMPYMKVNGLALATSLSSLMNVVLLVAILRKRLGPLGGDRIMRSFLQVCVASFAMGLLGWLSLRIYDPLAISWVLGKVLVLGVEFSLGVLVFLGVAFLLRLEELGFLWKLIVEKWGSKRQARELTLDG